MIHRHLILRAFVTVVTAAAVGAPAASAMPTRDAGSSAAGHATNVHHSVVRNPALVDAAAHAATIRAIGAKRVAQACR